MKAGIVSPGNPAQENLRNNYGNGHLPNGQALPGGKFFSSLLRACLPPGETTPTQGFARLTGFSVHQPPHRMQKYTPLIQARLWVGCKMVLPTWYCLTLGRLVAPTVGREVAGWGLPGQLGSFLSHPASLAHLRPALQTEHSHLPLESLREWLEAATSAPRGHPLSLLPLSCLGGPWSSPWPRVASMASRLMATILLMT